MFPTYRRHEIHILREERRLRYALWDYQEQDAAAQVHPTIKLRQVKGTVLSTAGRAISSLPQNMPTHRLTAPLQSQQQVLLLSNHQPSTTGL